MSCFLHEDYHISAIVNYAARKGLIKNLEEKKRIGSLFLAENLASYTYRYPQASQGEECNSEFLLAEKADCTDGYVFIKAASSLIYQSCEHPGYENSEAFKMISFWMRKVATWLACADERLSKNPAIVQLMKAARLEGLEEDEVLSIKESVGAIALRLIKQSNKYERCDGWEIEE